VRRFYVSVEALYEEVGSSLPTFTENPCQGCNACCTASHTTNHSVTELEFAFLTDRHGTVAVDRFRDYIARARTTEGDLIFERCPFNDEANGCTIHPDRPLSCRLYGHYRAEDEPVLADFCVFKGREVLLAANEKRTAFPGNSRLNDLSLEYSSHFPAPSLDVDSASVGKLDSNAEPLDLFLESLAHGKHHEALQHFERIESKDRTPLSLRLLGSCYQGLDDFVTADRYFQESVEGEPDNPQGHYKLGSNKMFLGDLEGAKDCLKRSLEKSSDASNSLGLLGMIHVLEQDFSTARGFLEKTLEIDKDAAFYHLQLGLVLDRLGFPDEARERLLIAQGYAETREQAEEALEEIAQRL
jgi:Fe-S-cluster containining protein/Flp pilus assembly protein TadD